MSARPPALRELDSLFSTAAIGHEAISDIHRELVELGRSSRESRVLLDESAQITLSKMPAIAAEAHRLAAQWEDERVLNPEAAEVTLRDLSQEIERIEPELRKLLDRQQEIATRLRRMLDE